MSATYKFASDIYTEYMSTSIKFDRISLFTEASRTEYDINRKEALLKTLKEAATDEEYYSFLREAEESFIERAKNTIKKFIDTVKQFIDKCKERIVKLITDLKQMVLLRHLIVVSLNSILRQQRLVLLELPMVMRMKSEIFLKRPCRKLAVR